MSGCTCGHRHLTKVDPRVKLNASFRIDPSRTLGITNAMIRDGERRFNALIRQVRVAIVEEDVFDIEGMVGKSINRPLAVMREPRTRNLVTPGRKAYAFRTSAEKIEAFMAWLQSEEARGVLEIIRRPGTITSGVNPAWTDVYVQRAYERGLRRAHAEMRKAGIQVTPFDEMFGGVRAVMQGPAHVDRIGLLYSRTYESLKSVTAVANGQIRERMARGLSEGLARGVAEGKHPRVIARELYKNTADRLDKIGKTRLRTIARTEVIRAHHQAMISDYEAAEADMEVEVLAEWLTAGFAVCPICIDLAAGGPYKLPVIRDMIPAHPNCVAEDTRVLVPGRVAGLVAEYNGTVIELTFSSGRRLTCTPNHMLLTPRGFIFAKAFREGDYVVACPGFEGISSSDPHDDRGVARIDDVLKTLRESSGVSSVAVPVAPVHLHGDARYCEDYIHVVRSDRHLRYARVSGAAQHADELEFGPGGFDTMLSGLGSLDELLFTAAYAADGGVGGSREASAAVNSFMLHPELVGGTGVAERDPLFAEYPVHWGPGATETLAECFDRFARQVMFDEVVGVDVRLVCHMPVYDLQSTSTIYIANGILSSNCRCTAIPVVEEPELRTKKR